MTRLCLRILFLLVGFQGIYAQTPDETNTPTPVKIPFKKTEIRTEKTPNELPQTSSVVGRSLQLGGGVVDLPNEGADQTHHLEARTPSLDESNTEAGRTAGSLAVSLTGGANYSVPVMLPPGIKDVVPQIGISYSSQASNGLAGWGWNISGLSTISRIPQTKYYDNKHDGVDFTNDHYALDGDRLILKSGAYGANGSTYQLENNPNVIVIASGHRFYPRTDIQYGPSLFVVNYPDGTKAWYGNVSNSSSRMEWAIYAWSDPQGNRIEYSYESNNGLLRIKTINYGGRPPRSTHPNEISFKYRSRVRPEQVYVGEHSFKRADLLDRIEITSNGATYRSYQLRYNRTSLGYQRLQSVQEYNGANKALSPIIFDYENTASRVEDRLSSTIHPRFDYKSHALIAGDYNGDGQTDVVFYSKNTRNKIYMHTDLSRSISLGYEIDSGRFDHIFSSTILSHNNKVLGSQAITTVSDMGASAQFQVRFRTFAIAAYGPVFQYDKIWHEAPTYRSDDRSGDATYAVPQKYLSGDFNGDGLTDVIAIEKPYTIISRCNNSVYNDRCQEDRVANNTVRFINLKRFQSTNFVSDSGRLVASIGAQDKLLTADHNGDGRQDIYHFTRGKLYIGRQQPLEASSYRNGWQYQNQPIDLVGRL